MATTNHMGITLLEQSQSQKEVTMNQALAHIDALMNTAAKSRTTDTPPGSPAAGEVYIVGSSPTGDWSANPGDITYYDQIWRFITPNEGVSLWVEDESVFYTYDGANWTASILTESTSHTRSLWMSAAQMVPSVTAGCAALAQSEISAGQPDLYTLDFDAATQEHAQFAAALHGGWDAGAITATFYWSHAATVTNFDAVWGVDAVACGDGDTIGAAYGTAQTVTDTGGITDDLYISAQTADITIAGSPDASDVCFFRVFRKAADAADNLSVDARLHGVRMSYTVTTYDEV